MRCFTNYMTIYCDLVDIRLSVYVAKENSLTRAAVCAHMPLTAASTRIKNLEQSTGTKPLNRQNHGITLRQPGQALLLHVRRGPSIDGRSAAAGAVKRRTAL